MSCITSGFAAPVVLGAKTLLEWVSAASSPNLVNTRGKTKELGSNHSDLAL